MFIFNEEINFGCGARSAKDLYDAGIVDATTMHEFDALCLPPVCHSVLSITGNISQDKKIIDTVAILNKQADDVTHEGSGARFIGHDTYEKIA